MITKQALKRELGKYAGGLTNDEMHLEAVALEMMAELEEYQGWTNRETWCVALHLNNTQAAQERAMDLCAIVTDSPHDLQDEMRDLAEDCMAAGMFPGTDSHGFRQDALNTFLARVDWAAIVKSFQD